MMPRPTTPTPEDWAEFHLKYPTYTLLEPDAAILLHTTVRTLRHQRATNQATAWTTAPDGSIRYCKPSFLVFNNLYKPSIPPLAPDPSPQQCRDTLKSLTSSLPIKSMPEHRP